MEHRKMAAGTKISGVSGLAPIPQCVPGIQSNAAIVQAMRRAEPGQLLESGNVLLTRLMPDREDRKRRLIGLW
jgi:hypothetical protein